MKWYTEYMKEKTLIEKFKEVMGMRKNPEQRTRKYTRKVISKYSKTLRRLSYE